MAESLSGTCVNLKVHFIDGHTVTAASLALLMGYKRGRSIPLGNILCDMKTHYTNLVKLSVIFPQKVTRLGTKRIFPICGKGSGLEVKGFVFYLRFFHDFGQNPLTCMGLSFLFQIELRLNDFNIISHYPQFCDLPLNIHSTEYSLILKQNLMK